MKTRIKVGDRVVCWRVPERKDEIVHVGRVIDTSDFVRGLTLCFVDLEDEDRATWWWCWERDVVPELAEVVI